jgi:hypothetical protein
MRSFLYQDHFVAIARRRLGRGTADVLLVDAGHRHNATIARLSQALDVRLNLHATRNGGIEVEAYEKREGTRWHGSALHLETRLPETMQQHMVGRPLGDVVSGSGADEWLIASTCDTAGGTTLTVDARWVDAKDITLPLPLMIAGPLRRAVIMLAYDWRSHSDRSMLRDPGWWDVLIHLCLISLMVFTLLAVIVIPPSYGMIGEILAVPLVLGIAWHTGTMIQGLRADIRRWPKRDSR